jgi:serine acetyltransferase
MIIPAGKLVLLTQRVNRRFGAARQARRGWTLEKIWLRVVLAVLDPLMVLVAKAEVLDDIDIGEGVFLSDRGHLVIGARRIGAGTHIHHCVTIGRGLNDGGRPTIGRNVWIGPDCLIYGNIEIGDGATILPGTVLTRSIPENVVVQGNPARVLRRNFDNVTLRSAHDWDVTVPLDIDTPMAVAK